MIRHMHGDTISDMPHPIDHAEAVRKRLKISYYELAQRIGSRPEHVSRIMRKLKGCNVDTYAKIAHELGIKQDEKPITPD